MQWLTASDRHIFTEDLRRQNQSLDLGPVRRRWLSLSDQLLDGVREAIPNEWAEATPAVDHALDLVRQARDNIDGVMDEVRRVLT